MKINSKLFFLIFSIVTLISLGGSRLLHSAMRGHSVNELSYLISHPVVIIQKLENKSQMVIKELKKKHEEKKISAILMNKKFNFPKYSFNSIALNRLQKTDLPPTQPILVVIDDEKRKQLGRYLGEILLAEGINEFQLSTISDISSDLLERFDLVILTQIEPESDQQTDKFKKYLDNGGNLIIMKSNHKFDYLCGLISTDKILVNGYIRLLKESKITKKFLFKNIQFHGVANVYKSKGAEILAYLSKSPEAPSMLPAITNYRYGRGTCVCFAYDFISNIVYTRQGNPNLSGKETDGVCGLRPNDLFHDFIDVDRDWIPQADIHQHILSNLILELTIPNKPLPRWYSLPNKAKAIMILSGDGERIKKTEFFTKEAREIETYDGKITYYLRSGTHVTPRQASWLHSKGDSTSIHPFFSNKISEAEKVIKHDVIEYWLEFGSWPKTIRTHWLGWYNYIDQPKIYEKVGIQMDLTYVSFIPASGSYMCGSAFPMRFADPASGQIFNVYQQPTQFEDDIQLGPIGQRLSIDQATKCSVQMLDKSIKMFHEPIVMNFHPLYYFPDAKRKWSSGEWARRIMRYAVENNVPIYNVEQWLSFWEKREQAIFNNISFRENVLSFNILSEDTDDKLCLMIPLKSANNKVKSVQQNKKPCPYTVETIWGMDYAMATIQMKAGEVEQIRVKYLPLTRIKNIKQLYPD